jgi:hypothetical protein
MTATEIAESFMILSCNMRVRSFWELTQDTSRLWWDCNGGNGGKITHYLSGGGLGGFGCLRTRSMFSAMTDVLGRSPFFQAYASL